MWVSSHYGGTSWCGPPYYVLKKLYINLIFFESFSFVPKCIKHNSLRLRHSSSVETSVPDLKLLITDPDLDPQIEN